MSLFLGDSPGCTDSKVLGSDEGITVVLSYGEVYVAILENSDGITLGIDVGTQRGY